MTAADLATLFGYSRRTITAWIGEGMPRDSAGAHTWIMDRESVHLVDPNRASIVDATIRYKEARAAAEEMKEAISHGLRVYGDDARVEMMAQGQVVRSQLVGRLAEEVSARDPDWTQHSQIASAIDAEIYLLLCDLSNTPVDQKHLQRLTVVPGPSPRALALFARIDAGEVDGPPKAERDCWVPARWDYRRGVRPGKYASIEAENMRKAGIIPWPTERRLGSKYPAVNAAKAALAAEATPATRRAYVEACEAAMKLEPSAA